MANTKSNRWLVLLDLMGTVTQMEGDHLRQLLKRLAHERFDVALTTSAKDLNEVRHNLMPCGLKEADFPQIITDAAKHRPKELIKLAGNLACAHCILIDDDMENIQTAIEVNMNAILFGGRKDGQYIYTQCSAKLSGRQTKGNIEKLGDLILDIRRKSLSDTRPKPRAKGLKS